MRLGWHYKQGILYDTSELVNSNFILQIFCQIESQNYCTGAQPLEEG